MASTRKGHGDKYGNVVHLYERDCSVQRRHQKVVEIAPAVDLDPAIRELILSDSVKLAKHIGYVNAGTVEFLVDASGKHYFMEVNPRIQVEHTVTEEVTGVDLVCSQLEIARGVSLPELGLTQVGFMSLPELGLTQDKISCHGSAVQCRITTEDPENGFIPDTGRIVTYRSPGGYGVRLDRGSGYAGSVITPFYDSLLVKCITRAGTYERAVQKMNLALSDFRVRGVKTNISFLQRVMKHPEFSTGAGTCFVGQVPSHVCYVGTRNRYLINIFISVDTSFIEKESAILLAPLDNDSIALKTLRYLGEVLVNGPNIPGIQGKPGALPDPLPTTAGSTPPRGYKQILDEEGADGLARAVRRHDGLLLTDTTWRDAHQSLLMTRMRTRDIMQVY
eukprot:sb/3465519/